MKKKRSAGKKGKLKSRKRGSGQKKVVTLYENKEEFVESMIEANKDRMEE